MKMVKIITVILISMLLTLPFMNCAPSTQTKSLLGSSTSVSEAEAAQEALVTSAPFAYDLVMDTISYNSCVGLDLNSSNSSTPGISGIKVGVNEGFTDPTGNGTVKAGLKLGTEFLNYVGKNVPAIFPSTVVTTDKLKEVLQKSTLNKDSYIQFALRKRSDLSPVLDLIQPSGSETALIPRDGYIEGAALASDPVLSRLTKNVEFDSSGTVLKEGSRFFNLYPETVPTSIEASFGYSNYADTTYPITTTTTTTFENFGFGEAYAQRLRKKFNSSGTDKVIFAMTYGNRSVSTADFGLSAPIRPSSSDNTKAYGRGYAFKFISAGTKAGWGANINLLNQVTETNLADGNPVTGANWTCENFVIMKRTHWNNPRPDQPACSPLTPAELQNATIAKKVKKIRRHYLESAWKIGLYYPKSSTYLPSSRLAQPICLVPESVECYLETLMPDNTDIGINYDPTTECYLYAYSVMGVTYTNVTSTPEARKLGRCAQYSSICVRE